MAVLPKLKNNWMLLLGIALILIGAVVLSAANSKEAECTSVSGKIVQFLDPDTREDCAGVKTIRFIAYVTLALGVAFTVINFIRRN